MKEAAVQGILEYHLTLKFAGPDSREDPLNVRKDTRRFNYEVGQCNDMILDVEIKRVNPLYNGIVTGAGG